MPELPDVEGFRQVLARHAVGKPIRRVEVRDRGVLRGRRFRRPERHGKWLIARTDGSAALLFHFGMTGSLWWRRAREPEQAAVDSIVSRLGPDALGVSRSRPAHRRDLLARSREPAARRIETEWRGAQADVRANASCTACVRACRPRSRRKLARARVNGRMTVWCPRCQRER